MRTLDLSIPPVPSRRHQMPYLCTMLCTSNISYLRAIRFVTVPLSRGDRLIEPADLLDFRGLLPERAPGENHDPRCGQPCTVV